jgi:hypothetical protein
MTLQAERRTMQEETQPSSATLLRNASLILPLLAIGLCMFGDFRLDTGKLFPVAPGTVVLGLFAVRRFLLMHILVCLTIVSQAGRFFWFSRQRSLGRLFFAAGALYSFLIVWAHLR